MNIEIIEISALKIILEDNKVSLENGLDINTIEVLRRDETGHGVFVYFKPYKLIGASEVVSKEALFAQRYLSIRSIDYIITPYLMLEKGYLDVLELAGDGTREFPKKIDEFEIS